MGTVQSGENPFHPHSSCVFSLVFEPIPPVVDSFFLLVTAISKEEYLEQAASPDGVYRSLKIMSVELSMLF